MKEGEMTRKETRHKKRGFNYQAHRGSFITYLRFIHYNSCDVTGFECLLSKPQYLSVRHSSVCLKRRAFRLSRKGATWRRKDSAEFQIIFYTLYNVTKCMDNFEYKTTLVHAKSKVLYETFLLLSMRYYVTSCKNSNFVNKHSFWKDVYSFECRWH